MNGWMQIYQSKVTTAEKAVRAIESGMRLFLTGNCSVPQRVLAALVEYALPLKSRLDRPDAHDRKRRLCRHNNCALFWGLL